MRSTLFHDLPEGRLALGIEMSRTMVRKEFSDYGPRDFSPGEEI